MTDIKLAKIIYHIVDSRVLSIENSGQHCDASVRFRQLHHEKTDGIVYHITLAVPVDQNHSHFKRDSYFVRGIRLILHDGVIRILDISKLPIQTHGPYDLQDPSTDLDAIIDKAIHLYITKCT